MGNTKAPRIPPVAAERVGASFGYSLLATGYIAPGRLAGGMIPFMRR